MVNWVFWAVVAPIISILFVIVLFVYTWLSWNIPVTVLRFTGDKRRPALLHTKGRKAIINGVPELRVRGYKDAFRDFKSANYYPSPRKKFGALCLFEYEDGKLTPLVPSLKKFSVEDRALIARATKDLTALGAVDFDFDENINKQLVLKMVDDSDITFMVVNQARQNKQYQSTFERLIALAPYGMTAFIFLLGFIGFVMWLKEDPGNAASKCMGVVRDVSQGWLEQAANTVSPPG